MRYTFGAATNGSQRPLIHHGSRGHILLMGSGQPPIMDCPRTRSCTHTQLHVRAFTRGGHCTVLRMIFSRYTDSILSFDIVRATRYIVYRFWLFRISFVTCLEYSSRQQQQAIDQPLADPFRTEMAICLALRHET